MKRAELNVTLPGNRVMAINSPDRKTETNGTGINDHCTETASEQRNS
jgi:hypothetical protein